MDKFEFPNNKITRLQRQKRRDKRLAEELIECRRYNGGDSNKKSRQKGERKYLQKMEYTGFYPSHESIDFNYTTRFGDNLEPLERFLRSNVGRPWSEVYSKLSQQLDRTTVSGEHVFEHLQDYMGSSRWTSLVPTETTRYRTQNDGSSTRFGVHPDTGLLCIVNPRNPLSNGPFPKKARYKKAKQRLKLKMRLGLLQKSRPEKSRLNIQEWIKGFVQQQVVSPNGFQREGFLHQKIDFWEDNMHIILNLSRLELATFPQPSWKDKNRTIPANRLQGRLWIKYADLEKPIRASFVSLWELQYRWILDWEER